MIGVIGAMEKEVKQILKHMQSTATETISGMEFTIGTLWGKPTVVAISGVGKVNAAMCTQTMILNFLPHFIINSGVAGGLDKSLDVCDAVVADAVVQHDMDTSGCGDPLGFISGAGLNLVDIPTDNELSKKLLSSAQECGVHTIMGKIASGDQFVSSHERKQFCIETFGAAACEMEAAAIGQVCYKNQVPFAILRSISDGADDSANMSYDDFVLAAVDNLEKILEKFYSKI